MPNQILNAPPPVTFPMACESCQQCAAMPYMAGTSVQPHSIRVAMRCGQCGHEWAFEMPSTSRLGVGAPEPI